VLAVYVSGHGFGHATRTAEVLRAVRERAPVLPVAVSTAAPASLFEGVVDPPLTVRRVGCDVGLAQKDALVIDEKGTVAAWQAFMRGWDGLVASEAAWLREAGAGLVVGDIPPLAFEAAARAGLPSVAVGNFSWDWIYGHLAPREPALAEAAARARESYGWAEILLRLPFACDASAFRRVEDVPLVARRPVVPKAEARRRLGLDGRPVALLSFGGVGLPGLRPDAFRDLRGFRVLFTGAGAEGPAPAHFTKLDDAAVRAAGLGYPDLVGAADVVVTKPGYGIVSDCIGAGTRLVFTERGDFPEYPVMVAEMPRYLPAVFAPNEDVRDGRLGPVLEAALALPFPEPPRTDGATVVAETLLGLVPWLPSGPLKAQ
jgi:L-arabinokinase